MSRLYLIRHGLTEGNERHLYYGKTDLSLSEKGVLELRALKYDISGVRFVTSGMARANETLGILFGETEYSTEPAFRELDFGIFEMKSYEELKDNPEYQSWITGDFESNIPPEGESGNQMKKRVLEALPELLREDTVLVSHGGTIAYIMQALFPEENKNRYQWLPKPGHGYAVENGSYREIP